MSSSPFDSFLDSLFDNRMSIESLKCRPNGRLAEKPFKLIYSLTKFDESHRWHVAAALSIGLFRERALECKRP